MNWATPIKEQYRQQFAASQGTLPHHTKDLPTYARERPYKYTRRRMLHLVGATVAAPAILTLLPAIARGEPIPIWHFGANGNVSEDATEAINKALSAMNDSTTAGPLLFRRGVYQTTSQITTTGSKPINLIGEFNQYDTGITGTRGAGTWFFFNHLGKGILFNSSNGIVVKNLGSYRGQPTPGGGWAPLAADYDFYFAGGDVYADNIMMYNATKGMALDGVGRGDFNRIRGQAFRNFIAIDEALDTVRLTNCHEFTFWSSDSNVTSYMVNNLNAYQWKRADNPMMMNCFAICVARGIYILHGTGPIPGDTWKLKGVNIDIDGAGNGLYYDSTCAAGIFNWFTNLSCSGGSAPFGGGIGVLVQGAAPVNVWLTNYECNDFTNSAISVTNNSYVRSTGTRCFNWDKGAAGFPCFNATAGSTIEVTSTPSLNAGSGGGVVSGGGGTYTHTP